MKNNINRSKGILIEGLTESEILELSRTEDFQEIIFTNEPVIFQMGTSEILGQFRKSDFELEITLSHIIGGGEGVLPKLLKLFKDFSKENEIQLIKWNVLAVNCGDPNPKLIRLLELKDFCIVDDPNEGRVYQKIERV